MEKGTHHSEETKQKISNTRKNVMILKNKICLICKKIYLPTSSCQKICVNCSISTCCICNNKFKQYLYKLNRPQLCSQSCACKYNKIINSSIGFQKGNKLYLNHIFSNDERQKMSDAKKGDKNPMFEKNVSEEIRKKISDANKGEKHYNFGKHLFEESRKKMSISHIGLPINKGAGTGKGSYYESPIQGKVYLRSSYELKFAQYLDKNNISWLYEIETFNLGDTTYTPDFFLPTCNLFIEIKGYMRKESQEKINKFLDNYNEETLKILYKKDLIKLGIELLLVM